MSAEALDYWRLATQYLGLAEAASAELAKTGNAWVLISDGPITDPAYQEATRWSDHQIGVAVLFNFYHGIELMLKGFIGLAQKVPRHHCITQLLTSFEEMHSHTHVGALIASYTSGLDVESPLGRFFATNCTDVNNWYQALKYPESKDKSINHLELQYGSSDTIGFWQALAQAAHEIRVASVNLAQSLEPA